MAKLTKEEFIQLIQDDSVMSIDEIAKELNITNSQVRYAIHTGMQKLYLKCIAKKLKHKDCFD